jgi:glyceraldehyde 3-phosphate dehydrogenase
MQKIRVGVNGLGRIGKCVIRAFLEHHNPSIEIVALNSNKMNPKTAAHMLQYDSVHGRLPERIIPSEDSISYQNKRISISAVSSIEEIDWHKYNVDVVFECTGAFNTKEQAYNHIRNGAKSVIVSAPCTDADATVILGVNEIPQDLKGKVISVGSCTTNCLAPVIKPLHDSFGITSAFMTTIHAYTNDQCLLDSRHSDLRRGRAAESSIIPTSTGAAKVIGEIIPELKGKVDGVAVRVPVQNVSMIDLTFTTEKQASIDGINQVMIDASKKIPEILGICDEQLVSIDFNHMPQSSIFDITQTKKVSNNLYRVVAWYDNEWGFSNRMIDICKKFVI